MTSSCKLFLRIFKLSNALCTLDSVLWIEDRAEPYELLVMLVLGLLRGKQEIQDDLVEPIRVLHLRHMPGFLEDFQFDILS